MRKLPIFLLLLTSVSAFSMTETFLRMPPNKTYMNFAINHYIKWHSRNFQSNFFGEDKEANRFISKAVNSIDHWLVPGSHNHYQFLVGHELKGKRLHFTFRIYIHPGLRSDPFLKKISLPKKWVTSFLEWDSSGEFCVLGGDSLSSLKSIKKLCKDNESGAFVLTATEKVSDEIHQSWPNPFPYLTPWEIRTLDGKEIQKIFYFTNATHPSKIPRGLDNVIYLHSVEAHFPFDKYSISKDGKMTVFYP